MRGTFMLINDDGGGLHLDKREMNIVLKDNIYPKTTGKVLSFPNFDSICC